MSRKRSWRRRRTSAGGLPSNSARGVGDRIANEADGLSAVAVSPAQGLLDDDVDDAERIEILRRDLHAGGRVDGLDESRQRIEAAASGEATVYMACSSIRMRLAVAMATAPPDPPSPITTVMIGTPTSRHLSVERAMASACPRSSAPMPG